MVFPEDHESDRPAGDCDADLYALSAASRCHSTFMPFMKVEGTTLFTDCARLASQ